MSSNLTVSATIPAMARRFLNLRTARFVLAWFVAFLFVAGIAPALHAAPEDTLCAPTVAADAGKSLPHVHKLECPQCAGIAAPPPTLQVALVTDAPLARAVRPLVSAHIAGLTGAPLPARGPPAFS